MSLKRKVLLEVRVAKLAQALCTLFFTYLAHQRSADSDWAEAGPDSNPAGTRRTCWQGLASWQPFGWPQKPLKCVGQASGVLFFWAAASPHTWSLGPSVARGLYWQVPFGPVGRHGARPLVDAWGMQPLKGENFSA